MGFFDRLWGKKKVEEPALSPREYFAREVEALFRAVPGVTVKRGADEFTLLVTVNGEQKTGFLENVFYETREVDPERRREVLRRFVANLVEALPTHDSLDEVRDSLAVTLRGPYRDPPESKLVAREVLPCLREYLVIDDDYRIAFCSEATVAPWKTPIEALFRIGGEHLARVAVRLSRDARGVFSVDNGDDYESARLLVPGFLAGFRDKVQGRPIAVVPTRNQLYVAGDVDPAIVISLCELAEREYAASPRRVSAAIYSVDDEGRVVRYVREVKDQAALRARLAHVRFEGNEYSMQKEALQEQAELDLNPAFIASFGALTNKAGETLSWASVARELQTWLPRTELLVVDPGGQKPSVFAWEEVERVTPHRLVRVPGLFPPRWETRGDFTPEELGQLTPFPME